MTDDKDEFERKFWGNCTNTFGEEMKQLVYARRMGLGFTGDWRSLFNIDMRGKSVIDIGGGPVSLLLKCTNLGGSLVIDPMPMPEWVEDRYTEAGITLVPVRGEDLPTTGFDEAWIYNCLQHVDDPALIIRNARAAARLIRLFEWIDIRPYPGHPHMLTEHFLSDALGCAGDTEWLNESGAQGHAFFGVFPT